ncbi:HD-GYP domain-containing protein [Syntrophomonas palmitatica]|uniref:HD-GYP domain-containing protein n=1 Tax=Syntrophomonas palmitatica TaxID=402877 RepID=UPI0006D12BE7|nr:HD domain-containing phosphohydrolase [Syntrophomonas palmitatica]
MYPGEEGKMGIWQARDARHLLDHIRTYMQLISNYDPPTYTHCLEVANLCRKWSVFLGLRDEDRFEIYIAALIHDLGKIYLPRSVLYQNEPLKADDWEIIRVHPQAGAKLIIYNQDLDTRRIKQYILAHHERCDGQGYPLGLKREEIPVGARLIAIADAMSAMTSLRPYRLRNMSQVEACQELSKNAGTQFDPEMVQCILNN